MPRHLIRYANKWVNEIPTVPIYYLAKPQPGERAWWNQRGKKILLSLKIYVCLEKYVLKNVIRVRIIMSDFYTKVAVVL